MRSRKTARVSKTASRGAARKKKTPRVAAGSARQEANAAPQRRRPAARRVRESATQRHARALRVLEGLRGLYPDAACALHHRSAFELLVATVLSAQCTDARVNMVTPALFERFPTPTALAAADPAELEELIRSTGFYRNKARHLIGLSRAICERFEGRVPDDMERLLQLPGVARKTANCVLGTWFGKNVGVVVDTHVGRLAQRLGLLGEARDDKDAVRIERDLQRLFPQEAWTFLSHALIEHGRQVCAARKPACGRCALAADCPSRAEV